MPAKKTTKKTKRQAGVYDESKVKTLSSLEHIRLRYGMYIGRLGDGSNHDDGIYVLLKEVMDNAVDEYVMGYGKKIDVSVNDKTVSVRDYGRGIPLGKVIDCVSRINTGAKYDTDVFRFSVGLNGVGAKAVNALSEHFLVRSIRDGSFFEAQFAKGVKKKEKKGRTEEKNGTYIEFRPDPEIFPSYAFDEDFLDKRFRHYSYLNRGLAIHHNGTVYKSEHGLRDLLEEETGEESLYPLIHFATERLEFALTHAEIYGETYYAFVNGQFTSDGGTHLSAFREGILKGINEYAGKSLNAQDVREGVVGTISIRIDDPVFESQTKNKLGNTDIRGWIVREVKKQVADALHRNKAVADAVLNKIAANERLRKDLQGVKRDAKEMARKTALNIPKLKDCKYHLNDKNIKGRDSMIFIVEGQSAAGSIISSRDVLTQAVFSLKGKPLNCHGEKLARVYRNEELYNIMKALGIEDNLDGLRYSRIIVATDADVDGLHIRNLLITYFLTFFEPLVQRGRVAVLETPLFRVRNKKETRYCYTEKERDEALQQLGGSPEVTRFKGLGEISPHEFGQFIGPDMRVTEVKIREIKNIPRVLEFYMGRNTPERKAFIMENLV